MKKRSASNKANGTVCRRTAAPQQTEPSPAIGGDPDPLPGAIVRPGDWVVALLASLFSGLAFFHHMAPEVTLQDSGELVTGAFTFGVPHPPGYPLWALLGFVWSHFIVPFGNPAWRIGTLSAVTGAATVGVMALVMIRTIRLLLRSLPWSEAIGERTADWIAATIGFSSAVLFGFNRGVWLWACVSEMRVLNVFSFILISATFMAWMLQPKRRGCLYATLLLLGLSLANHQTIAVMAAPFAIGALVVGLDGFVAARKAAGFRKGGFTTLMTSLSSFGELAGGGLLCLMTGLLVFAWLKSADAPSMPSQPLFWLATGAGALGVLVLVTGHRARWWGARRTLLCAAFFLAGASLYLYMPLAASTNPPMNWSYAATKAGFLHSIIREQYNPLSPASWASSEFLLKIGIFAKGIINQYSWPLSLLGWVPLVVLAACWRRLKPAGRAWLIFVWAAFFATSFGLLTIINPKVDRQEQEITIKFFAPAHGFYGMLIGYGLATLLSLLAVLRLPTARAMAWVACAGLLALPAVTYTRNWSLCALHDHDFGYLFGYLMFQPGEGYPAMERDAVLFGGTDPGRFVPTYMIFCESKVAPKDKFRDPSFDRSDVYIITQNALADGTYMSYIRDHYDNSRPKNDGFFQRQLGRDTAYPKESIGLPNADECNGAFREYIEGIQAGRFPSNGSVRVENGRVQIEGVEAVMAINGILAQKIFERNKARHAFYVEESYVIPWMYPYLRPHGVIMRLEKDPLPSPQENPKLWQEIVNLDHAYWDKLFARFMARPEFLRNADARKSFSKLRSAIGGLYLARGLVAESEYAFRQAVDLCPESPEASFRLADLYARLQRWPQACTVMENYLKLDVYNEGAKTFLENIKRMTKGG